MMQVHDIGPWVAVLRDLIVMVLVPVVAAVLKKKFGVELDLKERERVGALALDAVMYAEQLARSPWDITKNDGPEKKAKALQFAASADPKIDLGKIDQQIEAELGKLAKGLTGQPLSVHADKLVVSTPPPPPVPGTGA